MATRTLSVEIIGDASKLTSELNKAESATKKTGAGFSKVGAVAGIAGAAIVGGLVAGLKSSASAAMDSQRVQAQTESQLKALGISYGDHAKQIDKVIQSTSRLSALDDEDLQGSFNDIVRATGNVSQALKDTALAADIARGKHISLDAASKLVTKAELGQVASLKRVGLAIAPVTTAVDALKASKDGYTKAEMEAAKAADLTATKQKGIAELQGKFAGAAKAYGETAEGAQDRMRVSIENLQESIGSMLLPVITKVSNAIATLADWMQRHQEITKIVIGVLGTLGVVLLTVAAAVKIVTIAQTALNLAMSLNPIGLVILALVALGAGLVLLWTKSETFREIVTGSLNAVKSAAKAVADFFTVDVPAAFNHVLTWLRSNWPIIAVIIAGPFAPMVALATNAFGIRSALEGAFNAVKNAVGDAIGDVVGAVRALPGRILAALGNVSGLLFNAGSAIIGGLLDGLTSRLGEVEHLASSIAGKIAHLKGPIEYDRKLLVPHGQAIIDGLRTGMEGSLGGLLGSVGGYAPAIQSAAPPSFVGAGGRGGDLHATFVLQTPDGEVMWRQTQRYALRDLARNGTTGIR